MELRCPSRLHGILADGHLEVKCRSAKCGAGNGTVVLHYFDHITGEFIKTLQFTDPAFSEDLVEPTTPQEKHPACR